MTLVSESELVQQGLSLIDRGPEAVLSAVVLILISWLIISGRRSEIRQNAVIDQLSAVVVGFQKMLLRQDFRSLGFAEFEQVDKSDRIREARVYYSWLKEELQLQMDIIRARAAPDTRSIVKRLLDRSNRHREAA